MSVDATKFGAVGAAVLALLNLVATGAVNNHFSAKLESTKTDLQQKLESTKTDLQAKLKEVDSRIKQQEAVASIETEVYLKDRLKTAKEQIEDLLLQARKIYEGELEGKEARKKADEVRIKVLLAISAAQPRPDDPKLRGAAQKLTGAIEQLRTSMVENNVDLGPQAGAVIMAWGDFQAEVFRVAKGD